ncbi:MAG: S-layer homology domain-containing protein [Oscillospiraceae bacterium]
MVQPYARDAVSALAEVGCVTGYETDYLKPRDPISRQEVAALFYKLLDRICDDPQELRRPAVLYWGTEPLPRTTA